MTPEQRYHALSSVVRALVDDAARQAGVPHLILFHRFRSPTHVRARTVVWRQLRELGWSYPEIGDAFGYDHSTVIHALKKVSQTETR